MRLGVINNPVRVSESVEVAKACEASGFWGFGISDTVPALYLDTYVTAGACFAATQTLKIGPMVTNTVARHWSVLSTTARTFNDVYPDRFFAGVATGDGACHSVGLSPSTWARLEQDLANARSIAPENFQIQIAASGPRGCETAGRLASDLVIFTGLDVEALRNLAARARTARAAAGITTPLRIWGCFSTYVAPNKAVAEAERIAARGRSTGRFAFASTFEDKAVPEKWQPILRERYAQYNFKTHGVGEGNPNGRLFDDHPDLQEYLTNRFQLIGTADECRSRLQEVAEEAGLDGAWFALMSVKDEDVIARVRTTGEAFESIAAF